MYVEPSVFYGIMRIFLSGYRTRSLFPFDILVIHLKSETRFWNVCLCPCIGGKTTPVCQRGLFMKGSRQNQCSIQVGALHRAACCTALMNFWESSMKQKVVRWQIYSHVIDYNDARGLIVVILPLSRCLSIPHEELHDTCTQATDPGHLVATMPKEFCPAAGQWAAKPRLSALCQKTVGFAQLPYKHRRPLHHCTCCLCTTKSCPEPGIRGGDNQQSTHSIRE